MIAAARSSDRFFAQIFRDEKNMDLSNRGFSNALFERCTIRSMRGASFVNCLFEDCEFTSHDVRDAIAVTATLNCAMFDGLRLSTEIMDALVFLVTRAGGESERQRLRSGIPQKTRQLLDRIFPLLE